MDQQQAVLPVFDLRSIQTSEMVAIQPRTQNNPQETSTPLEQLDPGLLDTEPGEPIEADIHELISLVDKNKVDSAVHEIIGYSASLPDKYKALNGGKKWTKLQVCVAKAPKETSI